MNPHPSAMPVLLTLLAILAVCQLADGASTYQALSSAGAVEANPVMRFLIGLFGCGFAVSICKLGGLYLCWLLYRARGRILSHSGGTAAIGGLAALYVLAIAHNTNAIWT